MTMKPDDREFIDQGKELLEQEWHGSYEEEQTKMYLGLLLTKYEELEAGGVAPQEVTAEDHAIATAKSLGLSVEQQAEVRNTMRAAAERLSPDPQKRGKLLPIIEAAERFSKPDDVTRMTVLLMKAWGENDTNSDVSQYPTSYVATFVDMARAVLAAPVAVDEAKLADVRSLVDSWNSTPDYVVSEYDKGRVEQRHEMTTQLLEVLGGGER